MPSTKVGWTASQIEERLPKGAKARIARRANCHKSAVSQVIRGRSRSRKIEGFIAQVVKAPREEIFPVRPTDRSTLEAELAKAMTRASELQEILAQGGDDQNQGVPE